MDILGKRYERQKRLPGFGDSGQCALQNSVVAVVGAGGLGSPILTYLVTAGIGNIVLIDDDRVEESNLARQFLHTESSLYKPKVESASRRLQELNSEITVSTVQARLNQANGEALLSGADIVVDATDSFESKQAIAKICEVNDFSLVWGTISGHSGFFASTGLGGPSILEIFPDLPPQSLANAYASSNGVLGLTCGVIGRMMAILVIKKILHQDSGQSGNLHYFDGRSLTVTKVRNEE